MSARQIILECHLQESEYRLTSMLMKRLESVPALETLGPKLGKELRIPLATFWIRSGEGADDFVPAETISPWMDREVEESRVLIGAGGFETLPFLRKIAVTPDSTARASLYFYNTEGEIEIFIHGIEGMMEAQEKRR